MATTDLKLDEPGSLPRPGPVGRLARLGLGVLCVWYVYGLIQVSGDLTTADGGIRPVIWNGILFGLFLVSYVVNIVDCSLHFLLCSNHSPEVSTVLGEVQTDNELLLRCRD